MLISFYGNIIIIIKIPELACGWALLRWSIDEIVVCSFAHKNFAMKEKNTILFKNNFLDFAPSREILNPLLWPISSAFYHVHINHIKCCLIILIVLFATLIRKKKDSEMSCPWLLKCDCLIFSKYNALIFMSCNVPSSHHLTTTSYRVGNSIREEKCVSMWKYMWQRQYSKLMSKKTDHSKIVD